MTTIPPLEPGMREFGTPRENEEYRDGGCGIIIDPETQMYAVYRLPNGLTGFFSGGVEEGEDMKEGVLREVREESGLYDFAEVEFVARARAHYHNRLKNVNRIADASCFVIKLRSRATQPPAREAHETFELDWVTAPEILKNWDEHNAMEGRGHWTWFLQQAVARAKERGWDTTTNLADLG